MSIAVTTGLATRLVAQATKLAAARGTVAMASNRSTLVGAVRVAREAIAHQAVSGATTARLAANLDAVYLNPASNSITARLAAAMVDAAGDVSRAAVR